MAGVATPANVRTRDFQARFSCLPEKVRDLATLTFRRFCEDPRDPILELHPLHDTRRGRHRAGSIAVSVGRRYRALYVRDGGTNVWYWIGSHEDYNNFVGK
jgi:hypothetical protein